MTINFFGKYFKAVFTTLLFIEVFSLLGYLFPSLNYLLFFSLLFLTLILSLTKLEYGIYIILAELFIGSKGYLFFFDYNGTVISLRIALFLVVMAVWLLNFIKNKKIEFRQAGLFWHYIIFFLILLAAVINGFWRNEFSNAFFDANAWLYFALILPFYEAIKTSRQIGNILQILTAGTLILVLKTLGLLYLFSHNFWQANYSIYRWVRTSGVGEITALTPNFSRIFIQSQIYALILLFIVLCFIIYIFRLNHKLSIINYRNIFKNKIFWGLSIFIILTVSVCFVSFSRSFWAGGLLAALFFLGVWIFVYQHSRKFIIKTAAYFIFLTLISVGLIYVVANFPYPKITGGLSASLIGERATAVSGEAGASSRWNLLPKLASEIEKTPIFGAGFGKTVTYKSSDPRILERNPGGAYTTYAFEWGYLDIWLKMGLLGLVTYFFLLVKIWRQGWQLMYIYKDEESGYLIWGLLMGMVVVAGTTIFSPYLNHPLGIGYIILLSVIFRIFAEVRRHKTE